MNRVKTIGVIPVRYDSKRFPGKALVQLWDKSILQHVYERAAKSSVLDTVIIAADDTRIQEKARSFDAPVVMTSKDCLTGSDRVAQVVKDLDCEIVVNIQADQPLLPTQIVEEIVKPLLIQPELLMATPIYPLTNIEGLNDPNIVKVIVNREGYAIYFSRSPIPYVRDKTQDMLFYKHIGVYAYRKEFLLEYTKFPVGHLEETEGLEQLRVLENGYRIKTVLVNSDSVSVDTKEDLELIIGKGKG